jgi:TonB dependent receptor
MPKAILSLLLLLTAGAPPVHAQVSYFARIGAVGASRLLRDFITTPIVVRQSIAPMLALGGSLPLGPGFRAGLEATVASGGFHSTENGDETDLGTLRTGSLTAFLEGPLYQRLRWHAGLGGITYWPADETGIFARGGTTRFLAGAGADYRYPLKPRWDLMASARYDYHRFSTKELDARGFSHSQAVGRVSLSVGVARGLP